MAKKKEATLEFSKPTVTAKQVVECFSKMNPDTQVTFEGITIEDLDSAAIPLQVDNLVDNFDEKFNKLHDQPFEMFIEECSPSTQNNVNAALKNNANLAKAIGEDVEELVRTLLDYTTVQNAHFAEGTIRDAIELATMCTIVKD